MNRTWLALALLLLLSAPLGLGLEIRSAITEFLPVDTEQGALLVALSESSATRTMVLSLSGANPDALSRAGETIARALGDLPEVEHVLRGPSDELQRALYDTYFAQRFSFFSDSPKELSVMTPELLRSRAEALRLALTQPFSPWLRELAVRDPLLLFAIQTERMMAVPSAGLVSERGQFFTTDHQNAIVFVTTKASAFNTYATRRVLNTIDSALEPFTAVRVQQSGMHLHALQQQRAIAADLNYILCWSLVGIGVLFFLAFGTLRAMLHGALPVALGILCAIWACHFLLGSIHGLSLAFGASLVGSCIDYSIHAMVHPHVTPSIRRSILLSAATTLVSFAVYLLSGFSGLSEIALFGGVGITVATLATLWLSPVWRQAVRPQARWLDILTISNRRRWPWYVGLGVVCVTGALGLGRLQWATSLSQLSPLDPEQLQKDSALAALKWDKDADIVLVEGESLEAALAHNDVLAQRLAEVPEYRVRSLHSFLWSQELQRQNRAMFAARDLPAHFRQIYAEAGFDIDRFSPEWEMPRTELTLGSLWEGPLRPMVAPFVLRHEPPVLATFVQGADPDVLDAIMSGVPTARRLDTAAILTDAYGTYLRSVRGWTTFGFVLVVLLVLVGARSPAPLVPALCGAAAALGLLGWLQEPVNLMHLVGVLLVVSMGVDYGILLRAHADDWESQHLSSVATTIACVTTLLSFGLLALSSQPALASLGLVVAVGIPVAFLSAPLVRPR